MYFEGLIAVKSSSSIAHKQCSEACGHMAFTRGHTLLFIYLFIYYQFTKRMDTTQKASLYKVLSNTQLQQIHNNDIQQVHKQKQNNGTTKILKFN